MTRIVGIAGSLRKRSYNRALLRAAAELRPEGVDIDIESIDGVPIYDADVEADSGIPERVHHLKELVAAADGLLLVSPEYNNSVPGPLKNAIDWMTRPASDIARVFSGRPVGVIGATPGQGGTLLAQAAWLPVFRTLGTEPYFGKSLLVRRAGDVFDDDLRLVDDDIRQRLADYLQGFAEFAGRRAS